MKINKLSHGALAACLVGCLSTGCEQKTAVAPSTTPKEAKSAGLTVATPAVPNGFNEAITKLDVGGPFLMYLSTNQMLSGLSTELDSWKSIVLTEQQDSPEAAEKSKAVFSIVGNLLKKSGIEELDGIGASVLPVEPGLIRSKFFVQHSSADLSKTLIWNLFGAKPHALDEMQILPSSTALAYFTDFDLGYLWGFLKTELEAIPEPEISAAVKEFPAEFEKNTQLKWDDVLASLDNRFGFLLTLSPDKKIEVPLPTGPMELPEFALTLVIKTKNSLIFDKVDTMAAQMLPDLVKTDEGDVKLRSQEFPTPIGVQITPTLAQSKDYLILSTSLATVKTILDCAAGKTPGIAATPEFKKLRENTPQEGNSFSFVTKGFGELITKIQKEAMKNDSGEMPPAVMEKFLASSTPASSLSVSSHSEKGWWTVVNSTNSYADVMKTVRALPGFFTAAGLLSSGGSLPDIELDEEEEKETAPAEGN